MEIGNQIKTLRQRKGVTQEAMAEHLGLTPQAISKWERDVATPDIAMLPEISAYFGVTIDQLFALTDDTRMERIQNMIWDVRFIPRADADSAADFLRNKAAQETENGRPYELLADLENHLAREHQSKAAEYALNALRRDPTLREAHGELVYGMGGYVGDWNATNHCRLIAVYKKYIADHPQCKNAYLTIMDQLIDDYRLEDAWDYWNRYRKLDDSYRTPLYQGKILWQSGQREEAFQCWEQMEQNFPDEWCVYHNIADYLLRASRYSEVEKYYRTAINIQKAPRYTDPFEALAQFYEMQGNYSAAISVLEELLDVFDKEWHFTEGETADFIRREISRLKCENS